MDGTLCPCSHHQASSQCWKVCSRPPPSSLGTIQGPWLSELQTLDPTDSLPICVIHDGDLSLATPTPQFSPSEGSLPWAPEATEKKYGRATEQGPTSMAFCPQSLQLHQPRGHCSAMAKRLSEQPSSQEAIGSFKAAMRGQRTERGISRLSLPFTDPGLHLATVLRLSQASGSWLVVSWGSVLSSLQRRARHH